MPYVLVIITIFTNAQGIATHTQSVDFETRPACEAARSAITEQVITMKGQAGREIVASCHARR